MKGFIIKFALSFALVGLGSTVSAHESLNDLMKLAENNAITNVDKGKQDEGSDSTIADRIKESEIPAYSCQKVYETDENGTRLKNEDGTDKYRVFLVDRSGNKVSPEVVAEQSKQINNAILTIAGKVGVGALTGYLSGGGKGALIGIAAGLGLSVNDLLLIIKLKKESNKQKKAIEAYRKSFDEEGNPVAAEIDKKTLKVLNIDEENAVVESTEKIKKELSDPAYTTAASNESIDALLEAATKA